MPGAQSGSRSAAALAAAASAAALALALSAKHLLAWWRQGSWDGLASVVSFSAKLIAASRAVESQEENPLVTDPLAEGMAGPAAVANSRRRAQAAPEGSGRRFKLGKMAIRTRWFDDQIEAALGMPVAASVPAALRAPSAAHTIDMPAYVWEHPSGHAPRQLVMLGAGMDSRPWRMKLPADLRWFELDQPDVIAAKQQLLRQLLAEVPGAAGASRGSGSSLDDLPAEPGSPVESGLSRHLSIDKTQFPLRCGSWAAVPCDLSDASWVEALKEAGWDPAKPTVWVAEGLLMYLEEERVRSLLRTMAGLSAEGSAFIGLSVTSAVIDRIRARGPSKGTASLMDTWVFGCPPDPTEFLAECGWRLRLASDRAQQAAALGLDPELCAFLPASKEGSNGSGKDAKEAASLFMTATPLAAAQ